MAYSDSGGGSDVGGGSFFNPSRYLANQLGRDSGYAYGPERALLSALLFDGVQSYMNFVTARSDFDRSKYKEAYNWVSRRGEDYVFSFESVCEALGVDAEFLRLGLINAMETAGEDWTRARRNF